MMDLATSPFSLKDSSMGLEGLVDNLRNEEQIIGAIDTALRKEGSITING